MTWSLKKFLSFRVKEIGECRPKADTVVGAEPLLLHVFFKEIKSAGFLEGSGNMHAGQLFLVALILKLACGCHCLKSGRENQTSSKAIVVLILY